jgi:hypothetical protein
MGLKTKVREVALDAAFEAIKSGMSEENLLGFADMLIDWVEETVVESETTVDDALILPACEMLRAAFGIEDNDEVEEIDPDELD